MSRALLLIISDFLLISLLALARFDLPKEDTPALAIEEASRGDRHEEDLIEVLKNALENEKGESSKTIEELESDKDNLESHLRDTRDSLKKNEEAVHRLGLEKEDFAKRYMDTNEKLNLSKKEHANLLENLTLSRERAAASNERVKLLQEQLQSRERDIEKKENELQSAQEKHLAIEREKQNLFTEMKIYETEKRLLEQNLVAAKADIDTIRVEKEVIQRQAAKLADGVSNLSVQSTRIEEEMRQMQPRSLNSIFSDFTDNRVLVSFDTEVRSIIGSRSRRYEAKSIFITEGKDIYALIHTRDTPFYVTEIVGSLSKVDGILTVNDRELPISQVGFLTVDPRLMVIAVSPQVAEQLDIKVFPLARDPLKYSQAVLIGSDEGYYGESDFKLDHQGNRFLTMQPRLFNRLFGEFSPSRSDLVFAKTGSFMGLMINKEYCVLVDDFGIEDRLLIGNDFKSEESETITHKLRERLNQLPVDLQ